VVDIRRFFRAAEKSPEIKAERTSILQDIYQKRIAEQFPKYADKIPGLFTKEGLRLATEKLHLYPFRFEDWAYELVEKAREAGSKLS